MILPADGATPPGHGRSAHNTACNGVIVEGISKTRGNDGVRSHIGDGCEACQRTAITKASSFHFFTSTPESLTASCCFQDKGYNVLLWCY